MGGYGGIRGKVKEKCYYDTGGHKVKDNNAIIVAETYMKEGKYVAFLQVKENQERADLSVEGVHTEVKGLTTLKPDKISERIEKADRQVQADDYKYPADTHRQGKIILLSKHGKDVPRETIIGKMREDLHKAQMNGPITAKVEVWIGEEHIELN